MEVDQIKVLEERLENVKSILIEKIQLVESLKQQRLAQEKEVILNYFQQRVGEDVSIGVRDTRVEFLRYDDRLRYQQKLVTLYFREDYDTGLFTHVDTSFYSTSESSEFELKRMVLIGIIGEILLEDYDSILKGVNLIRAKFKGAYDEALTTRYDLERERDQLTNQTFDLKVLSTLKQLETQTIDFGVLGDSDSNLYPSFTLGYTKEVKQVKTLKVLSSTASGKSATIEVGYFNRDGLYGEGVVLRREVFENVKIKYIKYFIMCNIEKIKY